MTPAQCRMARAALELGVRELADAAKVSTNTVTRFERGEELRERTVDAIRSALESAGVEFTNGGEPGVKLVLRISEASPVGKDYAFSCVRRGAQFKVLMDRAALEEIDGRLNSKQPPEGRLKRISQLVAPRVWAAFARGQTPADGAMRLSAADFRDP